MPIRKSNDTLFYLIGAVPVVWLALLLAQSLGGGLPELLRNLTSALEQPTNIVWTDKSLPTILICLAAYGMAVLLYRTNQGRTRDGEEHGSAAWATPASVNAQFAQKDSIPLTQHVRLGLDTHKHRRSLNVLVIGGSGAAKTRSFVLPNILTANTNCNGVQREHNKKLNNGLPILHKVPPKRDYGRYFCIMAEKGGTSHGGLTEKLSPFFHAKKQEVNAYGR